MSLTIQRHSRLNQGTVLQPATRRNITSPCDNSSSCCSNHQNDLACAIASPTSCISSDRRTSPKQVSASINVAGELLLVEELFQPFSVDHFLEMFQRDQSVFEPRPIEIMLESSCQMINGYPRMVPSQINQSTRYYECATRTSIDARLCDY